MRVHWDYFVHGFIFAPSLLTLSARAHSGSTTSLLWQSGLCLIVTAGLTLLVFGPLNVGVPLTWVLFPPLIVSALIGGALP